MRRALYWTGVALAVALVFYGGRASVYDELESLWGLKG